MLTRRQMFYKSSSTTDDIQKYKYATFDLFLLVRKLFFYVLYSLIFEKLGFCGVQLTSKLLESLLGFGEFGVWFRGFFCFGLI